MYVYGDPLLSWDHRGTRPAEKQGRQGLNLCLLKDSGPVLDIFEGRFPQISVYSLLNEVGVQISLALLTSDHH